MSNPFDDHSTSPSTMPVRNISASDAVLDTVQSPSLGPRSHSQDSGTPPRPPPKSRKKGSQHADVIDRLDFTGVGPMFHHDGPFDACAPSRNRHRNKAPMMAWTGGDSGPYPSAEAAAPPEQYYEPPKKKVDAIAEAWGIHEPEPYEEFFAGGGNRGDTPSSSIFNGKESHSSKSRRRADREHDEHRSRPARRGIPPPQPIFVPDPNSTDIDAAPNSSSPTGNGPKRSKSLMHRIRKMRDSPNVPVGPDYDQTPVTASPSYERPTHRSNNSFLGRFGSPKPEAASEPFIFIDNSNSKDKDLPAPPMDSSTPKENSSSNGYFDMNGGSGASPGLGRKTSLIKKVGRVVRGQR
ncbi:Pal1-domain-containing protein [Dendrothele bispora CBS 962.96]|uniref:Pal1-domain-containing protein n=1 Tax=Dendrothele bispora (strain CBS 962.96) TaxID=1314807 RepID=A0A4S8MYV4_DENBC|nr:Pal1-domain-containing protein [Dendrothele bispora CBS 962.96]